MEAIELIHSIFAGRQILYLAENDLDPETGKRSLHTYYYPLHRIKQAGYSLNRTEE